MTVRLVVSLVGTGSEAAASALMLQRFPTRGMKTAVRLEAAPRLQRCSQELPS